jgi:hypothetical protein
MNLNWKSLLVVATLSLGAGLGACESSTTTTPAVSPTTDVKPAESAPAAPAAKEGDAMKKEGDAMKKEGDAMKKEGDAMKKDATKKEGDAMKKEGDAKKKEGDAMKKEGDAMKKEGDAMKKDATKPSESPKTEAK